MTDHPDAPAAVARARLLYTARTHTTGGRDRGASRSSDGRLDVVLSAPGTAYSGTNPEQLLAAAWSACLLSAIARVAGIRKVALPRDMSIDAEVALDLADGDDRLRARFSISTPGLPRDVAQALVQEAHRLCPYSRATRGNVDVAIDLT